ncbi:NADP-dependent malic enzyme [Kitasatospora paracochleata]|uniref:Malate dehydrogenase (Oxaloacetate-decarboxylating) n=1 Tax=Kitasatospora paracochleata TaxID=58354 RepID=A0ABT1J0D7_9ACTN|nr:malic enzyme-like NAD(P)-binding protein [Kitasatospora paracochleata]MCP2310881.1 malate dehydrogenase (oxaloacetate-decarboxylating) [Kitasatospora paracochleata]
MSVAHQNRAERLTEDEIFQAHRGGKLRTLVPITPLDARALSAISTPGVARVARAIAEDGRLAADYTWAHRLVAVVSDGTAVLGLGDVGPAAALPVMEGKAALFKALGGLDSVPLVLATRDVDEIVETLVRLRPSFGAINLEDISAPRCFELERALDAALDCPVMHNDQHGTAIVVLAALRSSADLLGRPLSSMRVVVSGAGAAGSACARMLVTAGAGEVVVLDSRGTIHRERPELTPAKAELAELTNPRGLRGGLADVLPGADVFIGVSSATVPEELIAAMAPGAVVFALSNPTPEIAPELAARHASVVATGRSDHPNQISNLLACPGLFRGALDAGAPRITERMMLAAADAIVALAAEELAPDRVVPSVLDPRVAPGVAAAVAAAVREPGAPAAPGAAVPPAVPPAVPSAVSAEERK